MKKYSWVVLTNCADGADERFERWYDEVHIPDLLRIPGMVSAKRGRMTDVQTMTMADGSLSLTRKIEPSYRYLATYSIESADPEGVLAEVIRRANTPEMVISEDLLEAYTVLYEEC